MAGDGSHAQGCRHGALPNALELAQEDEGQEAGRQYQAHVKGHLHGAEFHRQHLAKCQHRALTGQGRNPGGDLEVDAHGYQSNAQQAHQPLLPVGAALDHAGGPHGRVRQPAKHQCHRQL